MHTPAAVDRLCAPMKSPTPQHLRIGVRSKGCAGLSYHLEYVDRPGKFDEVVEQDGVKVIIDSKALFSIIGSEMDWREDALRCVLRSMPMTRLMSPLWHAAARSLPSITRISRTHVGVESPSLSAREFCPIPIPRRRPTYSTRPSVTRHIIHPAPSDLAP